MTNMTVLAQFLRDEAGSSGDSYMQAANVVDKYLLLAAENAHLRTLLVGLIKPELQIHAPAHSAIDYAEVEAQRRVTHMMPATEHVLDEIRADQLRSVLNAKCPVTGPILDAVARGYVIDIINLLEK